MKTVQCRPGVCEETLKQRRKKVVTLCPPTLCWYSPATAEVAINATISKSEKWKAVEARISASAAVISSAPRAREELFKYTNFNVTVECPLQNPKNVNNNNMNNYIH